ncbi:hypothetical protein DFH06DRAFT_1347497 [Mycena polygramma]|nr:hypothetical protein DFH06DRAFT_1347497 [Mycena polygramma]
MAIPSGAASPPGSADNPLVIGLSPRRARHGSAANPVVVSSSPPRPRPGSAANPFLVGFSPPRKSPPAATLATRTLASIRAARQNTGPATTAGPRRQIVPGIIQGPRTRSQGPPSLIRQDIPRIRTRPAPVAQTFPPGVLGDAALRRARMNAPIRRRPVGWRMPRAQPLTVNNLLRNGIAPPVKTTTRKHQSCGICLHIKSHPVVYTCGHSHCYTCIRLWLEKDFRCPTCRTRISAPPIRVYEIAPVAPVAVGFSAPPG